MMAQRSILIIGFVLLLASALYPPFQYFGKSLGRHWLFSDQYSAASIDTGRLLIDWVLILAVCVGLQFLGKLLTQKKRMLIMLFSIPLLRLLNLGVMTVVILAGFGAISSLIDKEEDSKPSSIAEKDSISSSNGGSWTQDPIVVNSFSDLVPKNESLNSANSRKSQFDEQYKIERLKKVLVLISILLILFFLNRRLINWMHRQCHGVPHPALMKFWSI